MTSDSAMTSNQALPGQALPGSDFRESATRLEVWAEWGRHMQECDQLISARIGCSPAYWAGQREERFVYWEHEYSRAQSLPPPRDESTFAPGEYLRWSERHSPPARTRWEWLGWAVIGGCALWFAGDSNPAVHDFLTALFH